jgi:hypothetical protein
MDPHPEYWRIKAAELEYQMARQNLQTRLQEELQEEFKRRFDAQLKPLFEKRVSTMKEAGLDPAKNYSLMDDTQSITEIP